MKHRRLKLSMNSYLKLKSIPENPCHDHVSSPPPSDLFQRSKTVPPFGACILLHFEEADIDLTSIDSQFERIPPPWEQHNIVFDTLLSCFKKDQTSETVFRKEYQQLRKQYKSHFEAYTDGSKCEQKVAAAAFFPEDPDDPGTTRLRDGSSVFNAELEGLHLPLKKFFNLSKSRKNFIVYTDSFSAVESLRGKNCRIKNVKRFYNLLKNLPPQVQVVVTWIPSHVSISGSSLDIELGCNFTSMLV